MAVTTPASKEEFDEIISTCQRVVVDYFALWCGPCRIMAPFVEELAEKYPDVKVVKVDVDKQNELEADTDICGIPTFHLYINGEICNQVVGADKGALEKLFQQEEPETVNMY